LLEACQTARKALFERRTPRSARRTPPSAPAAIVLGWMSYQRRAMKTAYFERIPTAAGSAWPPPEKRWCGSIAFPKLMAFGKTKLHARMNLRERLAIHIAFMLNRGEGLPNLNTPNTPN
jgi:predicted RNase H-like HicB family nuclease